MDKAYRITGDMKGRVVSRVFIGSTQADAESKAVAAGLKVVSVVPVSAGGRGVAHSVLVEWTGMMADAIEVGIKIPEALSINKRAFVSRKGMPELMDELLASIQDDGLSFSEAIARRPDLFDEMYVAMVHAGESTGSLEKTLRDLYDRYTRQQETLSKVRGALVYPVILLVVLVVMLCFFGAKISPPLLAIFSGTKAVLIPLFSRAVLRLTVYFNMLKLLIIPVVIGGVVWCYRSQLAHRWMVKYVGNLLPSIREFLKNSDQSRIFGVLAMSFGNGVPSDEALRILCNVAKGGRYQLVVPRIRDDIRSGKGLSESFGKHMTDIDPLLYAALCNGEASGKIEQQLLRIAKKLDRRVDEGVLLFSETLRWTSLAAVSSVAGVVIVAIYTAIFSLGKAFIMGGG